jgi:hypothetical protein
MATKILHAHNYRHFEYLQLSAKEFYLALATLIEDYQYPDVSCKTTTIKEKGFFSSKREYLHIAWQQYHYYVCACPFGRSFFISWYLQEESGIDLFDGFLNKLFGGSKRDKTFYERDTELMFTQSIMAIIEMVIQKVKAEHGHRIPELDTATTA